MRDWVNEEIERIADHQLYGEDAVPDGEMDELSRIDTAEALSIVEAYLRAGRQLQGWLKTQLSEQIGEKRNMRYGMDILRVRPKRTVKVEDPVGLANWLGADVSKVFRLDGSNLRKTGLRQVCEERDADGDVIADTFLSVVEGETELVRVPINKAPLFLQDLDDGSVA